MAGLMDGEGTIGISYLHSYRQFRTPYVSMSTTTPEISTWLKDSFGGSVSNHKVYQEHHKPSQSWKLTTWKPLTELLTNILPHMLEPEKVRRGNLLLDTYKLVTVRNGKYTDEERDRKLAFEKDFLSL